MKIHRKTSERGRSSGPAAESDNLSGLCSYWQYDTTGSAVEISYSASGQDPKPSSKQGHKYKVQLSGEELLFGFLHMTPEAITLAMSNLLKMLNDGHIKCKNDGDFGTLVNELGAEQVLIRINALNAALVKHLDNQSSKTG